MKILVVGGAGYIGSHVAWELLKENYEVHILDREPEKLTKLIKKHSKIIKADICDYERLKLLFRKIPYECVIHLAGLKSVSESLNKPQLYSYNNLTGTLSLLNAMSQAGLNKLIFSSSAAIYGEPLYLPIDEAHPKNPQSYYGFTKLMVEECLSWYNRLGKLDYLALRYFNAAGYDKEGKIQQLESQATNLIPAVMEAAFGIKTQVDLFGTDYPTRDGTCIRDYIHVSDLAKAHVKGVHYLNTNHKSLALNLGTQSGLSVKEVFHKACQLTGYTIPHTWKARRAGDPAELYANSTLAQQELNWQAHYSDLDTLLESTYNVYKNILKHPKNKTLASRRRKS